MSSRIEITPQGLALSIYSEMIDVDSYIEEIETELNNDERERFLRVLRTYYLASISIAIEIVAKTESGMSAVLTEIIGLEQERGIGLTLLEIRTVFSDMVELLTDQAQPLEWGLAWGSRHNFSTLNIEQLLVISVWAETTFQASLEFLSRFKILAGFPASRN